MSLGEPMLEMKYVDLIKDYPLLKSWWEAREFPPANPRFMPPTGLMISSQGEPVCAGFLFKSDANAAIIGNIVSNPKATGEIRSLALDALLEALAGLAKSEGFGMVCCSTDLPRLMKRFEKHGFVNTDKAVSHFGRVL